MQGHKVAYACTSLCTQPYPETQQAYTNLKPTLNNLACFLNDQTTILNYIESQPSKKTRTRVYVINSHAQYLFQTPIFQSTFMIMTYFLLFCNKFECFACMTWIQDYRMSGVLNTFLFWNLSFDFRLMICLTCNFHFLECN